MTFAFTFLILADRHDNYNYLYFRLGSCVISVPLLLVELSRGGELRTILPLTLPFLFLRNYAAGKSRTLTTCSGMDLLVSHPAPICLAAQEGRH